MISWTSDLLYKWSFVQVIFCTSDLFDKWSFRQVIFCTSDLLYKWSFDKWSLEIFSKSDLLDKWSFGQVIFWTGDLLDIITFGVRQLIFCPNSKVQISQSSNFQNFKCPEVQISRSSVVYKITYPKDWLSKVRLKIGSLVNMIRSLEFICLSIEQRAFE